MKKSEISYSTFAELDIRVGLIKNAVPVEGSEKLLELTVDLGKDYGVVTILSGIAKWYTPDELVDKKSLFLANLAPRPMMGKISQGMLIAIDNNENEAELLSFNQELAVGLKVC